MKPTHVSDRIRDEFASAPLRASASAVTVIGAAIALLVWAWNAREPFLIYGLPVLAALLLTSFAIYSHLRLRRRLRRFRTDHLAITSYVILFVFAASEARSTALAVTLARLVPESPKLHEFTSKTTMQNHAAAYAMALIGISFFAQLLLIAAIEWRRYRSANRQRELEADSL